MTLPETIGYIAATLTTIAFVPQVVRIYQTKDTHSISIGMFVIFCSGLICWGIYGIIIRQIPIIVANSLTLTLSGYILFMKLTEKHRKK